VLPELRRLCLSGLQIVRRERVVLTNVPLRTFGTNPRTSSQRQTAHSHFQARILSVRRQHRVLSRSTACTCDNLLPPFLFHSFANRDVADWLPPLFPSSADLGANQAQALVINDALDPCLSSRQAVKQAIPTLQTLKCLTSLTIFPAPVAIFSHALFHSIPQAHLCCHINPPRAFYSDTYWLSIKFYLCISPCIEPLVPRIAPSCIFRPSSACLYHPPGVCSMSSCSPLYTALLRAANVCKALL